MQPLSPPGDKTRDRRVFAGRFQQLDAALAYRHHGHPDFFMFHDFFADGLHSQGFVKLARLEQRFYGNSEMVNRRHGSLDDTPA